MSARIDRAGNVYQLDRQVEPDEVVTEEDAKDAPKVARLLMRLLKDVAGLRRRFAPKRLDREDEAIVSTKTTYRFPHGLGCRVRWWIVQWTATSTSANYFPMLMETSDTDLNTLVLENVDIVGIGRFTGKVTLRIEAAN